MVLILLVMVGWSLLEVNRMVLMTMMMMMMMMVMMMMMMVTIFPISTQLHMHPNHEQSLGMWVS